MSDDKRLQEIRERLDWTKEWDKLGTEKPPIPKPRHMHAGWAAKDLEYLLDLLSAKDKQLEEAERVIRFYGIEGQLNYDNIGLEEDVVMRREEARGKPFGTKAQTYLEKYVGK